MLQFGSMITDFSYSDRFIGYVMNRADLLQYCVNGWDEVKDQFLIHFSKERLG